MAQRASGFARKPVTAAEAIAATATLARAMEDEETPSAVALELAPLIAPYRKHGRLSLRVERLPHRARLSRGHNNGDRSWSLMSDELDGLTYLPPKGAARDCTLSIRIVSLDGGDGATLALLDYPVGPENAAPPVLPRHAPEVDQAELRRLRDELAKAKAEAAEQESTFRAARGRWESELQAQLATETAADLRHQIDAALAKAEREWKSAEAERLARAQAEWEARSTKALAEAGSQLEKARTRTAAESAREKSDEAELRRLRDELAKAKAEAAEQENALRAARAPKAETRPSEAAADLRRQIDAALARAEREWKSAEAERLARAQAEWETRSTKALAEAGSQLEKARTRAAAESAREKSDDAERRRLRDEVTRLKKLIAAKDGELSETRETTRKSAEETLAGAEQAWRQREAESLAAARAQWQERSERALTEAKTQFERAEAVRARADASHLKDAEAELEALKDQLARANEILADRENDIADMQARLDEAVDQTSAIESREAEIERLKNELVSVRGAVAERERDIVASRAEMERARQDWQRQSEARFAQALAEWKRGEAARLLAGEAQAQEQADSQLTRMAQRLKQLEGELKDARARAEALRQRGDADDIKKLRREFGHLQSQLAERDMEIAQLRLDSEHARERWTAEARMSLEKAEHQWKTAATERRERRPLGIRRTARDIFLVASISVVAMMLYLHFDLASLVNLFPQLASIVDTTPAPQAPQPEQVKPASATAALPVAVVMRSANVRATPSKTADVVATLPRDSEVTVLEHHGSWVRVKVTNANKNAQGWVYTTYLKDKPVTPQKHN
jgi:Bacterial SH3 domain